MPCSSGLPDWGAVWPLGCVRLVTTIWAPMRVSVSACWRGPGQQISHHSLQLEHTGIELGQIKLVLLVGLPLQGAHDRRLPDLGTAHEQILHVLVDGHTIDDALEVVIDRGDAGVAEQGGGLGATALGGGPCGPWGDERDGVAALRAL
ncbi:hypothetical protein Q3G72_005733 [Acer saccharum]|nr:hypothetical protein Q3G72_005733 [Acer saccharum]